MKQQLILLREENDLLNSLIGQSFNQRTKFEAEKILTEIHSKAQDRSIGKMALCYVIDKNQVLGVGGSTLLKDKKGKITSNLILDNFGLWLAKIFSTLTTTNQSFTGVNTGGANSPIHSRALTSNVFNITSGGAVGVRLIVGSGSTPPARTDFFVQTKFITAPENALFASGFPVYNSVLGNFKNLGSILARGSGTINESALVDRMRTQASGIADLSLFRDIISPAVPFIAGQSIALEYTIQL